MYKILRIICCVIAALCVAGCVFAFVYAGTVWGIVVVLAAAAFFALTVLFKKLQEDEEEKQKKAAEAQDNEKADDKTDGEKK